MGENPKETGLEYGTPLRRLRDDLGVTLTDLAERAGISPSYLSELERGLKRPSTDVLARLAEALGMSPSTLLAYIESMTSLEGERAKVEEEEGVALRMAAEAQEDAPRAPRYRPPAAELLRGKIDAFMAVRRAKPQPGPPEEQEEGQEGLVWELIRAARGLPEEDVRLLVDLARRLRAGRRIGGY